MRKFAVALVILLALGTFAWRTLASAADPDKLLKVGDTFPSWSLPDQNGATVTSQSLAGKTYLLWFYPKAQTSGCTAEGRGLRDHFDEFHARGVEIIGVSFDKPDANAAFVKAEGFQFHLLSDTDHALAKKVGAASSDVQIVATRISYLVGPDGKIRKVYGDVTPATHAGTVLSDL